MKIHNPTKIGAVLGLLVFCPMRLAVAEPTVGPLEVRAAATLEAGVPVLDFSVKNSSSTPIQIYELNLPWGRRHAAVIVAVPSGADALKGETVTEDAFPRAPLIIRPGEILRGRVKLPDEVRGIREAMLDRSVIVFWYYAPVGPRGVPLGRYGGWVDFSSSRATS